MKKIITFLASVMAMVVFGGALVFGGAAMAVQIAIPLFVVPDAYTFVPGSLVDTGGTSFTDISFEISATLFGATFKVQGTDDPAGAATSWTDLLTTKASDGTANAVGVAVAVNTTVIATLDAQNAAGASALALRYFRLVAQNTIGASVANITGQIFGQ